YRQQSPDGFRRSGHEPQVRRPEEASHRAQIGFSQLMQHSSRVPEPLDILLYKINILTRGVRSPHGLIATAALLPAAAAGTAWERGRQGERNVWIFANVFCLARGSRLPNRTARDERLNRRPAARTGRIQRGSIAQSTAKDVRAARRNRSAP